jgi:hypothetical protein
VRAYPNGKLVGETEYIDIGGELCRFGRHASRGVMLLKRSSRNKLLAATAFKVGKKMAGAKGLDLQGSIYFFSFGGLGLNSLRPNV